MRKLFTAFFIVLFAATAVAAADIIATYKYPDGNMVTIVTRDKDHVRMDTSPTSYMLLQGDTVYSVSQDDSGQVMVMDLGQMKQANQQSGLASLFGGGQEETREPEYMANYEKTGRREKIAGYTGVVYNVEVREGDRIVRRDEVVLSTHSDIKQVNEAWIALGEKMSQAMGDEMADSLDNATREAKEKGYGGMLRYGDEMKLDSLKKMSLDITYYQLPENAQHVQMGQMPDMQQMQQQYEQQQQQYEQQEQQEQSGQDAYDQNAYDQQQQYEQQSGSTAGQVLEQDANDVGQAAHQEAKDQTVEEVKEGVKKLFDSLFD
jgi:hypothetical protein